MLKWVTVLLGLLLIGSNAWWLYVTIDQAITQSYREQVLYEYANRVIALSEVSARCLRGRTEAEVTSLLKDTFPSEEPFTKDGAVNTLWLSFRLDDENRVSGIDHDELVVDWAKPASAE